MVCIIYELNLVSAFSRLSAAFWFAYMRGHAPTHTHAVIVVYHDAGDRDSSCLLCTQLLVKSTICSDPPLFMANRPDFII